MTLNDFTTIDQLEQFLDGSEICQYQPDASKDERYQWVQKNPRPIPLYNAHQARERRAYSLPEEDQRVLPTTDDTPD